MKHAVLILVIVVLVSFLVSLMVSVRYVTGEYSKYCYTSDNVNKNIKHKIYFQTLKECNKPLANTNI